MIQEFLQKFMANLLFASWSIFLITTSIETGLSFIYFFKNKLKIKNQNKLLNETKRMHQRSSYVLIICMLILFAAFDKGYQTFFAIQGPLVMLYILINTLKYIIFEKAQTHLTNWLIFDTTLVNIFFVIAIFQSIINGLPFYYDNYATITSIFNITDLITLQTFYYFCFFILISLIQGSLFYAIKTKEQKNIILLSNSLATIISLICLEIYHFNQATFLETIFYSFYHLILISIILFLNLFLIFNNQFKTSFLLICLIIFSMQASIGNKIYPYIFQSTFNIEQNISIFNASNQLANLKLLSIIIFTCGGIYSIVRLLNRNIK